MIRMTHHLRDCLREIEHQKLAGYPHRTCWRKSSVLKLLAVRVLRYCDENDDRFVQFTDEGWAWWLKHKC
jgi:hypothetical protein